MQKEQAEIRKELRRWRGRRITVIADFDRTECRYTPYGGHFRTILLRNIEDENTGCYLCDHAWIPHTMFGVNHGLKSGDVIEIEVRVISYLKGYQGTHEDGNVHRLEVDFGFEDPVLRRRIWRGRSLHWA